MKCPKKKSIVLVAMLLILSLCFLAGCNSGISGGESSNPGSGSDGKPSADTFKIIADESKSIEYEEFDNGDPIEGIFTATPKKVSLYYVYAVSVYTIPKRTRFIKHIMVSRMIIRVLNTKP